MKKIMAILLAFSFVLVTSGCGSTPPAEGPGGEIPPVSEGTNNAATGMPVNASGDYAGAYTQLTDITTKLTDMVKTITDSYDASLPEDSTDSTSSVMFMPLLSISLAMTASLSENDASIEGIKMAFQVFNMTDVAVERPAPNEYIVTGKTSSDNRAFKYQCKYNTGNGALQMIYQIDAAENGSAEESFYEFVPLDGGRFVYQTPNERALVEFKDDKISSFTYVLYSTPGEKDTYSLSDSIYPNGTDPNLSWLAPQGEDAASQFYSFDGTKLHLAAEQMLGKRLTLDLPLPQ